MLLTACEKGLDEGIADVAPAGQAANSVLKDGKTHGDLFNKWPVKSSFKHNEFIIQTQPNDYPPVPLCQRMRMFHIEKSDGK